MLEYFPQYHANSPGSWLGGRATLALEVPVVEVIPPGAALDLLPGSSEGEQRAGGGRQEPVGAGSEAGEGEETGQEQLHHHPGPTRSLSLNTPGGELYI